MSEAPRPSILRTAIGGLLLALGVAVFVVRLFHDGAYAIPGGGNLVGGLGALVLGGILVWPGTPRVLGGVALAASPIIAFLALYATMAEVEEVISLYATDSAGQPAELRLWIVDYEGGEWVGMPRSKAVEHSLDGARVDMLRNGQVRCVVPVLEKDVETIREVHRRKVEKYAVARAAAVVGLYAREARETTAALRLDPCPEG